MIPCMFPWFLDSIDPHLYWLIRFEWTFIDYIKTRLKGISIKSMKTQPNKKEKKWNEIKLTNVIKWTTKINERKFNSKLKVRKKLS